MTDEIQQIIKKIAETNVHLNSNMEDVIETVNAVEETCKEVDINTKKSLEEIANQSKGALLNLQKDLDKFAQDNKNLINQIHNKISATDAKYTSELKETFQKIQNSNSSGYADILSKLNKVKEELIQNLSAIQKQNDYNKNGIAQVHSAINDKFTALNSSRSEMNNALIQKLNESIAVMKEETKRIRIRQAIYFWLFTILSLVILYQNNLIPWVNLK